MSLDNTPYDAEDIQKNKVWGIISYLSILFIIPLIMPETKDSPYTKFHINQGLILFILSIVISIFSALPLAFLSMIISVFGGLTLFVLWVIGFIGAVQGQARKIPLLGDIKLIQ